MATFRIISTPTGQAPEWVRKQWVGLVFPMQNDASWGVAAGALGGRPDRANLDGYSVTASTALDVLRQSGAEGERAAEWWESSSLLAMVSNAGLKFGKEFCEVVAYLPDQEAEPEES